MPCVFGVTRVMVGRQRDVRRREIVTTNRATGALVEARGQRWTRMAFGEQQQQHERRRARATARRGACRRSGADAAAGARGGQRRRRRRREIGAARIEVDDERELVAIVGRAGLIGADHAVDAGAIGLAEPDRAAAGDAIAFEHRADAVGAADLELLEIAGRQHDRAADEVLGIGAERVLAREVAHGLLDQRQEAADGSGGRSSRDRAST